MNGYDSWKTYDPSQDEDSEMWCMNCGKLFDYRAENAMWINGEPMFCEDCHDDYCDDCGEISKDKGVCQNKEKHDDEAGGKLKYAINE